MLIEQSNEVREIQKGPSAPQFSNLKKHTPKLFDDGSKHIIPKHNDIDR